MTTTDTKTATSGTNTGEASSPTFTLLLNWQWAVHGLLWIVLLRKSLLLGKSAVGHKGQLRRGSSMCCEKGLGRSSIQMRSLCVISRKALTQVSKVWQCRHVQMEATNIRKSLPSPRRIKVIRSLSETF